MLPNLIKLHFFNEPKFAVVKLANFKAIEIAFNLDC